MSEMRKRPKAQIPERMIVQQDPDNYYQVTQREGKEDWVTMCCDIAEDNIKYADEQLALGRAATARYFYGAASSMYMLSGYGLTELTEEKLNIYGKHVEYAKKFASMSPFINFEHIEFPYKDYKMDCYLVTPKNMKPNTPMIIMVPGATAFKDSYIKNCDGMGAAGYAALYVDGPGQGVTRFFNNGYLEVELEKAYSQIIDWVKEDGRFGKIAIIGGSTGGYYVARAAAADKRIDLCVINGGSYAPAEILNYSPEYRHKFAVLSGVKDEEMDDIFPKMTMEGLADKITCPLLIMHGEADDIFSVNSVRRIYEEAASEDKTFVAFPGAWHCCVRASSKSVRLQQDWLREHLK